MDEQPSATRIQKPFHLAATQVTDRLAHLPPHLLHTAEGNGKDVTTVQELLRHANSRITLEVYTQR